MDFIQIEVSAENSEEVKEKKIPSFSPPPKSEKTPFSQPSNF